MRRVDYDAVCRDVGALPLHRFNYVGTSPDAVYLGPVAGDWHRLFPCGGGKDERRIETMDCDGVALAAIKSLAMEFDRLERRLIDVGA